MKLAMKIIAMANQKGGAGKTTSTLNIGAGLSQLGKRVSILYYKLDSHGADDYLAFCREIVERGRRKMKKILLKISYLSDLVNEAIRDLVKKYKARVTTRQ